MILIAMILYLPPFFFHPTKSLESFQVKNIYGHDFFQITSLCARLYACLRKSGALNGFF
jgi:hypothetical protein